MTAEPAGAAPVAPAPGGPLVGVRVVEFAGIGPAPFGVMLLADLGADVVRIERVGAHWPDVPIVSRGRASVTLDLKDEQDRQETLGAIALADVLVEGYRPGVMERLGLGPVEAMAVNPRLIYARMTGWGQEGPLANTAGHDINFIGLSGMLAALAPREAVPVPPLNLLGDYAGGGLYLALGIVAALFERTRSGRGQVIDAAVIDGSASLLAPILGMLAAGLLPADTGKSMLAGVAPYYRVYRCADGKYVAVGPLEPHFRRILTERLNLQPGGIDGDHQVASEHLAAIFATRTRAEWTTVFDGSDACVTPVLEASEAPAHEHVRSRAIYVQRDGRVEPSPAPRFSRTPGRIQGNGDGRQRLSDWKARR